MDKKYVGGVSIWTVIAIVLTIMKFANVAPFATMKWRYIILIWTAPIWLSLAIIAVGLTVAFIITFVATLVDKKINSLF